MEVGVESRHDALCLQGHGEDLLVAGGRETDLPGMYGVDSSVTEALSSGARETLIQEQLQAGLGRSTTRSSRAVAA